MTANPPQQPESKPLFWVGSSRKDRKAFPKQVRTVMGQVLFDAQCGEKHPDVKPLKHLGGGVLEIVTDDDGNTYRGVYTVRFGGQVYVLHAFQKKSKSGSKTPASDIELIRTRLIDAQKHYDESRQSLTSKDARRERDKR